MKLKNLDRFDSRTVELAFEAAPHIQPQLQPLIERLDQDLGSKVSEIAELKYQVRRMKQELEDNHDETIPTTD
jgi:hypothetical protein